ncbi:MAG: hypothetical protein MK226_23210 [Saprospiraceae bacterium]|nr:hypothetical protein [Saprospiraceae bacterium]
MHGLLPLNGRSILWELLKMDEDESTGMTSCFCKCIVDNSNGLIEYSLWGLIV